MQLRVLLLLLLPAGLALAEDQRSATVGMAARIDQLVLPGTELEVKPLEGREVPVVVRITGSYPHGTDYRYDLEYYALEPGTYDLCAFLQRKDGSSLEDLPKVEVEIQSVLPPGQVEPGALAARETNFFGGYQLLLVVGAVVWLAGLLAILFGGRKGRSAQAEAESRPLSLADRLRPLVEDAMAGQLTEARQAELERTLIAFWRRRLDLDDLRPAEAMARLREHEEAGPLLIQLEKWLHRPGENRDVDVLALLEPYQNLPADDLTTEAVP